MAAQKRTATRKPAGIPWKLDESSRKALAETIEQTDPEYVNMLVDKVAGRIAHSNRGTSPTRQARPSISNEMGGLGFDLVHWIRQHPYKLIALGLGLAGGTFLFVKGVNYVLGRK